MNEEKLIELMKEHFPTKGDLSSVAKEMGEGFDAINEKLDELTASAKAVDTILEAHPVERLARLEQHAHLPAYVYTAEEE